MNEEFKTLDYYGHERKGTFRSLWKTLFRAPLVSIDKDEGRVNKLYLYPGSNPNLSLKCVNTETV